MNQSDFRLLTVALTSCLALVACNRDKTAEKDAAGPGASVAAVVASEAKAPASASETPQVAATVAKPPEPTALGDYEMKCTEQVQVASLVFDGAKIDTKDFSKSYAFNGAGTQQEVYVANFEPDLKMLESGNIDTKQLKAKQFLIKLSYSRRDNKANRALVTTISPYKRVLSADPTSTDEGALSAFVYTKDKAYGRRFLGDGMLTGVTTKLVCGKAKLAGEADDAGKYQLELTFSAPNRVL